jgi:hypothetical protein
MYHYVYYSYEEWGRGYIGVRSCQCLPEKDRSYFGSFFDKTFAPTCKIILSTFNSREKALQAEVDLHEFFQVHVNPHFANLAKQTTTKFHHGAHTEESKAKIGAANRGKIRSEELKLFWSRQRRGKKKKPFTEAHRANMGVAKRGQNNPNRGKIWWTNGEDELLAFEAPGEGWYKGRCNRVINSMREFGGPPLSEGKRKEVCSNGGRVGGKLTKEKKIGIFDPSKKEQCDNVRRMNNMTLFRCTVTGKITTAPALAKYQKNRGIDPACRERLPEDQQPYNKSNID